VELVRSLLALLAGGWFAYHALMFTAPGASTVSGTWLFDTVLDGDPGAVAVTVATRMVCVGLALLSAALIDWRVFRNP
jgi:hypothetical protein